MRRVIWPKPIRLLHALLAVSMIVAFFTQTIDGAWHEWPGYVALAAALTRLAWGLLPRTREAPARYSRFADFVRGPLATWHFLQAALQQREPRYLGHSPLAGWIVLALLLVSVGTGVSGWMLVSDRFFGIAWVMTVHDGLGHAIVPVVILHWLVLAYSSWRHRENLIVSMLHGEKDIRALPAQAKRG